MCTVYPHTLEKCIQKGVNLIVVTGKCLWRYYGSGNIFLHCLIVKNGGFILFVTNRVLSSH